MKDDWFDPHMAVWDNLAMAEVFTHMARQGGVPNVPLRWCINIATSGLWAAVDIMNHRIASEPAEKMGTSATSWFKEHEPLVHEVRNGAVHFSVEHGVGRAVEDRQGEDPKLINFVWVGSDFDGNYDKLIRIDDALSRLDAVRGRIERHVSVVTGQKKWPVHYY